MLDTDKNSDFQHAFEAGVASKTEVLSIHGVPHVLIPPGCELESLKGLLPAPTRIVAHPEFSDVAGFADYVAEFKQPGTRVFVDDSARRFVSVFDFHAPESPGWCDHSASIQMHLSPEWKRFVERDGDKMAPKEFAEFLEDNMAYIDEEAGGISSADILTMAQTYKVDLRGELNVEESLQKGLKTLLIRDESRLHGVNTAGLELEFPEMLCFSLRIFKNHDAYPIKVFLRTRTSKDAVVFWFKIPDIEGFRDEAFERVIDDVRKQTGLKVLKGKMAGPSHR